MIPEHARVALVIAGAMLCSPALADTSYELLKACDLEIAGNLYKSGFCEGYGHGVWDASERLCRPSVSVYGEVMGIFVQYIKHHPELLGRPAAEVIEAAINEKYPCKSR